MMVPRYAWFVLVAALLVPGVAQAQTTKESEEAAKAAVAEVDAEYVAAMKAGDLERYMAVWVDDGVQFPAGAPPNVGKAMIRANSLLGPGMDDMVVHNRETTIMGDYAFTWGTYSMTISTGDATEPILVDSKYIAVYQRQRDGSWKLYREMFNSNIPPD
ncbi:MAG: nuclear transport factor 2 family protein [Deinococcales bacterium]